MDQLIINDFCAVTEASDRTLHFTRVAVSSFLEKNPWFDGTILILSTKYDPLTKRSTDQLKTIYEKIIFQEVDSQDLDDIANSTKRKTKLFNQFLLKTLFIFSFNLKTKGTLYFSQNSLFLRSVDFLLSSSVLSGIIESNTIEGEPFSNKDISNNIFYIPLDVQIKTSFNSIMQITKFSDICSTPIIFSKIFNNYLDSANIPKKIYSNSLAPKSSIFPDKKISVFKSIQEKLAVLHVNTSEDSRRIFTKIHGIWNQKNSETVLNLSKPVKTNINSLIKKNKETKTSPIANIVEISRVLENDLIYNSGDSLKNKNIALCTICNDDFLIGAQTMIYSFLTNNPWFNHKIIVFHNKIYSQLSSNSMDKLSKIYPVEFREVNTDDYSKLVNVFKSSGRNPMRFIPSLLTFEAFELAKEFDKVLYLDADMLVLSDISELFHISGEIVVTPDAGEYNLKNEYSIFNGGFLLIDNSSAYREHKKRILEFSENMKDMQLADQSIMNAYFKYQIKMLDSRFNCLKRCFPDTQFNKFQNSGVKIIHYVGAKPWQTNKSSFELKYKNLENLWRSYSVKISNFT